MTVIHDEQSKILQWRVKSLRIFFKALSRYAELALPYATEDNTELFQEYEEINAFLNYISEQILKGDGEFDFVKLTFLGKNWGKIFDVLCKYNSWKKQLLDEKDRVTTIKAALEGDKRHLEEVGEILKNPCWEQFNRHYLLIDSLYGTTPPPQTNDPVLQQVFNVETLNGILAGTNNGTIMQNNESKEVLNSIQEIATLLKEGKISEKDTTEAFINLQILQGELLKPFPDNSKLEQAGKGLQALANFTQIGSFGISIAPHLHTIQQFIQNLPLLK